MTEEEAIQEARRRWGAEALVKDWLRSPNRYAVGPGGHGRYPWSVAPYAQPVR